MFISENSNDAPKVVEAITQISKQLSKGADALPALVKTFDAKTIGNIENFLKSTKD